MFNPTLAGVKVSPRVRAAATLYGSGAVGTMKEASEAAGMHPNYLSMLKSSGNEEVNRIISETQQVILDESMAMSSVMTHLGRKAISKIAQLMESSASERIQLEAARDLADRTPQTAKTQSHTITSFSLNGDDAKEIAAALVASAAARRTYQEIVQGDFVRIEQVQPLPDGSEETLGVDTLPST